VVKHEGYNLLGRPRRKWEDKITTDREGIGSDTDEIYLARKREKKWALVNTDINFLVSLML